MQERHSTDDNPQLAKRLKTIKALSEVVYNNAGQNIAKAQAHQKKNYDRRHAVPMFKRGNLVLRRNMANSHRMGGKMDAKWHGPYEVEEITEKGLYRLKCMKSGKVLKQGFSSLQLKAYSSRPMPKVMKYFECIISLKA